ncbi:MAG: hypothetical protein RIR48_3350, partial [Bacteroidota bacterium]
MKLYITKINYVFIIFYEVSCKTN